MEGILRFCKVGVGGFAVIFEREFGQFDKIRCFCVTFSSEKHLMMYGCRSFCINLNVWVYIYILTTVLKKV